MRRFATARKSIRSRSHLAPERRGGIGEFGTAGAKLPGTPANAQSSATCRPAFDASMLRAKLET